MENIISSLHDDGIKYIEETVAVMSLIDRQIFFVNCIKVIDKSYYDYVMTKSDESAIFFFDILKYAYPVLIKFLWTKDFETLIATPFVHSSYPSHLVMGFQSFVYALLLLHLSD